jgi:hypothetical protein
MTDFCEGRSESPSYRMRGISWLVEAILTSQEISLDGVIGLVKWGGILDRYGPNRNSTDRFSVVCILDFTKIREMFWSLFGKMLF